MSYATLMVYVDVDGHPQNRVSLATELSDRFKPTPIDLSALAIRPLFLDETFNSDKVTGADIEQMKLKIVRKEDWFQRLAWPVDGDEVAKQINDVADYLARHGISGDPRVISDRGETTGNS